MLYRTLKRVIEKGIEKGNLDIDATIEKLDFFYAADKLTKENYDELTAML